MGVLVILLFFVVVVVLLYGCARSRRNRARSNPWRNRRAPARFKVLCRDGCRGTRSRKHCDCYGKINHNVRKNINNNDFYHVGYFFLRGRGLEKNVFVRVCRALSVRLPDSRRVSRSNYGITHELENDEKKK